MNPGDTAPDFTLFDQEGVERCLLSLVEVGPVMLYFYPAAMTKGCTKESSCFRDLAGKFAALDAQRIGISTDSVARQAQFSAKNALDYPLLADVNGDVAKLFGVKRDADFLKVKRTTFVIGQDRRILGVISSELNMNVHAERALTTLATSAT